MIREDRDVSFWREVAAHPEVAPHIGLTTQFDIATVVEHPNVVALRSEHGGFLFVQLDGLGRVYELHTLFTPEGWGREVAQAARQAFANIFTRGAQIVTTYEVEGWWRSRPPRSFRFEAAGGFAPAPAFAASLRTWVLTRDAWTNSPVGRRSVCPQ